MTTIDYEHYNTSYVHRCFSKENGRLVATIQNFGDFARIYPAIGMDNKLTSTDWRTVDAAKRALERLAVTWVSN